MGALEKKLFRDLWLLRAQVSAIAVVVAAGVAIFFAMMGAYDALVGTQSDYYARYRLGDVFARVVRAPLEAARAAEGIPGVAEVRARVAIDVAADVPGLGEPAMLHIVSMPAEGAICGIYLRRGAPPERPDEIVVNEAFALADHLDPGSLLTATLNGRRHVLRVVGVGLSPEFVFQGGATLIPDDHRFGVVWMEEKALAASAGMAGAFNDLALTVAPGADVADVIAQLDLRLAPWGGFGAQGRRDGLFSDRILGDKIKQLRASAQLVPTVFLGVAAFLLNVVLGRLVATQRTQIGTLKAFGMSDWRVGLHYLELVLVVVLAGTAAGALAGAWLGRGLITLYQGYYHFPDLAFRPEPATLFTAAGIAFGASSVGAIGAVRRATALPPAEAMRPEPPPVFRAGVLDRPGARRLLSTSARMALRNLLRRPGRTALSVLGVAFAAAIMVLVGAMGDAIRYVSDTYFNEVQRSDATVLFADARPVIAARELSHLTGVLDAEPFRAVPATLRHGILRYRTAITGVERDGELRPLIDAAGRATAIPDEGVVLSRVLAEQLAVGPGDALDADLLEGAHRTRPVRVVAVVDDSDGRLGHHGPRRAHAPRGGLAARLRRRAARRSERPARGARRAPRHGGGGVGVAAHRGAAELQRSARPEPRRDPAHRGRLRLHHRLRRGLQQRAHRALGALARARHPARARLLQRRGRRGAPRRAGGHHRGRRPGGARPGLRPRRRHRARVGHRFDAHPPDHPRVDLLQRGRRRGPLLGGVRRHRRPPGGGARPRGSAQDP